jgi:MFS family permease
LKYIKGNLYLNGIISSASEITAYLSSGILASKFGMKSTLLLSYLIAIVGMVALILYNPEGEVNQLVISLMVLGSKFGVSQAFNIAYIGNVILFPVTIVASTYGVCNIFSRISTIFAPFVAELEPIEISQWIFVATCMLAFVASLNIKQAKN